jgi:stearoyl-CoA desaturase (delta-9 desaturase)
MVNFLVDNLYGLANLSLWGYVGVTFLLVQISMMAVTLYMHRDQAHRAIDLHPVLRHFFRFWIWVTSGMVTREWVSIHRKHHAFCEREGDPHSPQVFGLRKVLLEGAELYQAESSNLETLEKYGRGTPDDWVERNIYAQHSLVGVYSMLIADVILFGALGITVFAVQMLAMPVFSAGVINGLGHAKGYRNFECDDAATNLTPLAILVGGEELHNNHHAFPTSAKFSVRSWEFDIGWLYITLFKALGFCKVRRVAQSPKCGVEARTVDLDTLKALLQNRMYVLRDYTRQVTLPVLRMEKKANRGDEIFRRARRLLIPRPALLEEVSRARLTQLLDDNVALKTVHEFREQLVALWEEANVSNERLVSQLKDWCTHAEESGIKVLQDFSASLRGYLPQTVKRSA